MMTNAELASAAERAVLARVRSRLPKLEPGCRVIGIGSPDEPRWCGEPEVMLGGTRVRIVACPSLLAVLDALAAAIPAEITVIYTHLSESDLGDAILARMHRWKLHDADRYTQLADEFGARALDPRIRNDPWLVDALIVLAHTRQIASQAGSTLSRHRATALVAAARLGLDPDQADLSDLIAAFDDTRIRTEWTRVDPAEREGLVSHLSKRHGAGVEPMAALAQRHDDVLALLLVAQVLTAAPEGDTQAAAALGGFLQVRFAAPRPDRAALAAAGAAAVTYARRAPTARLNHQARVAEEILRELSATDLVAASPVLPGAFAARFADAAESLDRAAIEGLLEHQQAEANAHRIARVRAAARLRRWLASSPRREYATATDAVAHHARELAWVDRALTQVRAGDADPRVAQVLNRVDQEAGRVRAELDLAFAGRLAAAGSTPATALAVETLLPAAVAPLAKHVPVLLIVLDGMSGAVAAELTERITGRHSGWVEIVRDRDGGREGVLAALPTETGYSRTSLFSAELRSGDQSTERRLFPSHKFWPPGGATLIHKSGIAGQHGSDLGAELETAVTSDGPRVVAVVLNAIDDSLTKGRQSAVDPGWRPEDVPGLVQLLDRAVNGGRAVLLTSDHGHILEHSAEHRHQPRAAARWRPDNGEANPDEVAIGGVRVLLPEGRAIFAATESVRYGARAHGYHGGATLAEAAIPLIGLVPPGVPIPAGWIEQTLGPPSWWDGDPAPGGRPVPPSEPTAKRARPAQEDGLFEVIPARTRGEALVASPIFREACAAIPPNLCPPPDVFRAVVDALVAAGGRMPLAGVVTAAGAAGRSPRSLVMVMRRALNWDQYSVLELVDGGRAVELNRQLLDEQFPSDDSR